MIEAKIEQIAELDKVEFESTKKIYRKGLD